MLSKATFVLAFLAVAHIAVATPPACLLAAVNQQDNPGDMKAICGDDAKKVQDNIAKICGNDDLTKMAWDAFGESCKTKGFTVAAPSPSPSQSSDGNRPTSTSSNDDSSASSTDTPTGASPESPSSSISGISSPSPSDSPSNPPSESPTITNSISTPPSVSTATTPDSIGTSDAVSPSSTGAASRLDVTLGAAVAGAAVGLLGLL